MKHSHKWRFTPWRQRRSHTHSGLCRDMYRHLCENLDSKLNSEECKRIREHIESCENCHALLDTLKKTVYLYKEMPMPSLPKRLEREVFAVIQLEGKKRKRT